MSPTATIPTSSDAVAVAAAVAALGPLDREALLLRLRGRSIDEVAVATGTTPAMVRVRLRRAAAEVERHVGQQPLLGDPVLPDRTRPTNEVVTDAELGITPMLHARLLAALAHVRATAPPRFRRLAALAQAVAAHLPQLTPLAGVAGLTATVLAVTTGIV